MQKRGDRLLFSPSDLIQYVQSDFACWMERLALEHPSQSPEKPDPDEMMRVLTQLGEEHERSYVETLRRAGTEIYEIDNRGGFKATLAAMGEGKPLIYQGAVQGQLEGAANQGDWLGYADFLLRVEGRSKFGSWHYMPLECKLALNPKPYFVLQACAYCELLEQVQGVRPQQFGLVMGSGDRQTFRTDSYFHYYRQVRQSFSQFMADFDPGQQPLPHQPDHGQWQSIAESILAEADHLSLVANITQNQIKKLEAAGMTTVADLATAPPNRRIPKLDRTTYQKLLRQARLQQNSSEDHPQYEIIPPLADKPHSGLAMLPPANPLDVFFDMEGYPLAEGGAGLEYLFGATYVDTTGTRQFKDWWAHNDVMERRAFEGFMDWIWERWQRDSSMHVYHYAPYETTALKRLMGRYGTREEQLDNMLRGGVFVDLYRIVSQGLCVGESSYSIKSLERFYWRKRDGDVKNAQASVVQYFQWQQARDGDTPEESKILGEIRDYNRDDCDSTQALADWLRSLQTESGITYVPLSDSDPAEHQQLPEPTPAAQLQTELLEQPSIEATAQSLNDATRSLLAHLLQFHRREAKPFWWQRFTWLESEEADLVDELDCLAGLERTDKLPFRPSARSRSWAYEYRFDTDQETRLRSKTACWFTPSTIELKDCTLAELNTQQGTAVLTISDKKLELAREQEPSWEPGSRLSLMDATVIRTNQIADAILETVQQWKTNGELQPALADFLERRSPCITGHKSGPIIAEGEALLEGTLRAIANLDHSTLCIQGPPGSGKTFTAAQVIMQLLQQGKTVAVSANSHDVILNLLGRVQRYSVSDHQEDAVQPFKIGKVGGKREQVARHPGVDYKAKIIEVLPPDYQLVGATVFQLCRGEAIAQFDYLFVDEAGQVALANLMALARCAHNLVLIGDPMQLEQPIQGSHPGDSGQSALGYLLNGQSTIPADLGIFLDTSYRMAPSICRFISESVYDGRLGHPPETQHNQLRFEPLHGENWQLSQQQGIAFVGVEHQGNAQASDEEVAVIQDLIQQLQGVEYVSDRGEKTGQLTLNDILIVAPYNLQVRRLQEKLNESLAAEEPRVGTVDKFQGQEAPVVIISMCASTTDDAPRGIEFLLNRNRLNVAVSRAQCLAIVVASPALTTATCTTLDQMVQVNMFCKLVSTGR